MRFSPMFVLLLACMAAAAPHRVLRVCADPNNLPFSNQKQEGFENRIAEVLAKDLGAELRYFWWEQRRGFVRNTLTAGACDLMIGAPVGLERVLLTRPYYRSTYAFVTRKDAHLKLHNLDAPELRKLRVGVQLIGDDYTNTPPAHLLAARGIIQNVRGYRVTGDYAKPNPPARIVEAVANGDVDVAIVWGPLAGYFASREKVPLAVEPLAADLGTPATPLAFDIAAAVRNGNVALRDEVQASLDRNRAAIRRILSEYGVPSLPLKKLRQHF